MAYNTYLNKNKNYYKNTCHNTNNNKYNNTYKNTNNNTYKEKAPYYTEPFSTFL